MLDAWHLRPAEVDALPVEDFYLLTEVAKRREAQARTQAAKQGG